MRSARMAGLLAGSCFWAGAPPGQLSGQQFPPPLREGTQRIRWSSYVQFRYTSVENGEDLFALRRLKLMVGGNLTPRLQWYAQGLFKDGNASPTDGRVYFQEAWLRYEWRKAMRFVAGQFKPPFGRERFTPDFEIFTMDRSLVTDTLTPDGPYIDSFYRDRGFQVDGEPHRLFRYAAGLFDGRGAQHAFRGIGPMGAGQVLFRPFQKRPVAGRDLNMQLGGAYAARRGFDLPFRACCPALAAPLSHFRGSDRRWQVEVSADWGRTAFRAEYMRAGLWFAGRPELDFSASGYYVQLSQFLTTRCQIVGKQEALDPNRNVRNAKDLSQWTAGMNYYIHRNRLKVMTGYVYRTARLTRASTGSFQLQLQYFIH